MQMTLDVKSVVQKNATVANINATKSVVSISIIFARSRVILIYRAVNINAIRLVIKEDVSRAIAVLSLSCTVNAEPM